MVMVVGDGVFVGFIYLEVIISSAYYVIKTQYEFLSRQVLGIRRIKIQSQIGDLTTNVMLRKH